MDESKHFFSLSALFPSAVELLVHGSGFRQAKMKFLSFVYCNVHKTKLTLALVPNIPWLKTAAWSSS
jgi:hypothetical protein